MTNYNKLFAKYAPYFHLYDSPISIPIRMAQLYVESKIFTSELALKSNNGFGIKASPPWTGKTTDHLSPEVGGAVVSGFRVYPSHEASIADNASFFTSTPKRENVHYKRAIDATTVEGEAAALTGVYAGDPIYGTKLLDAIKTYNLKQYEDPKWDTLRKGDKMAYIGIDIGHGSNTRISGGGKAVYKNGKWHEEHNFNSIVAKKLRDILVKQGHKVTFGVQQPNSPETSLSARTNRFNAEKVDILVSVHANATSGPTNGIAVFYDGYSVGSRREMESKKLSKAIMAQYKAQGQSIYTAGMGDKAGSIPSTYNNWTNFHMNRESTMPSVLLELGFMTGSTDFDKIFGSQQDKYTTQMAEGAAKGINQYLGITTVVAKPDANPQGLKTVPTKPYVAPPQPFEPRNVGDKDKLGPNWQWLDISNKRLMQSKRYEELLGTEVTIVKVFDLGEGQGHSKRAYLVSPHNSIISEEYLIGPRVNWVSDVKPDEEEEVEYDEYEFARGIIRIRREKE